MPPIRINLVKLGNLKFPISFPTLEGWQSDLMSIHRIAEVGVMPNAEGGNWTYSDAQLERLVTHEQSCDITVAIINAPLENNFYLRRFRNNTAVLSLYETGDILQFHDLKPEHFIIKNLYEIVLIFLENNRTVPNSVYSVAHDETRSCLFDMCADKLDIVFSTAQPTICESCKVRLRSKQLDKDLLETLERELRRIRKALFYRISDFVKIHPLVTLLIAAISGLMLNVLGNILYNIDVKKLLELFE